MSTNIENECCRGGRTLQKCKGDKCPLYKYVKERTPQVSRGSIGWGLVYEAISHEEIQKGVRELPDTTKELILAGIKLEKNDPNKKGYPTDRNMI